MSRSQFHLWGFILRHAWLNLWDKHMTTGRINQVWRRTLYLNTHEGAAGIFNRGPSTSNVSTFSRSNGCAVRFHLCLRAHVVLTYRLLHTCMHKCSTCEQSNKSAIFANYFHLDFSTRYLATNFLFNCLSQSNSVLWFIHLKADTSPDYINHKTTVLMQPKNFFQTPLLHEFSPLVI